MIYVKTYQALARNLQLIKQNLESDPQTVEAARERIHKIAYNHLPSGNGIDNGVKVDIENSTPDKIILTFSFHHMDENGYYDRWNDYKVWIRPSLAWDFSIYIRGRNRNMILDYLYDLFNYAFNEEITTEV